MVCKSKNCNVVFLKRLLFPITAILVTIFLWDSLGNSESSHKYRSISYEPRNEKSADHDTAINSLSNSSSFYDPQSKYSDRMTLVVVSCGDSFKEANNLIKSAIALSTKSFNLEVFTEETHLSRFESLSKSWPEDVQRRVTVNIHIANYPPGFSDEKWKNLFRKCSSVRLFLPELLPDVDSLIYADADVLFLGPVENIWEHFHHMNSTQMVAMAQEHEVLEIGWYTVYSRIPHYGELGVNAGVMLMNLTRLRNFGWSEHLSPILQEYNLSLQLGDQDVINIIFHYHPDKLYLLGCEYNYRAIHCIHINVCQTAEHNGIFALHGNGDIFHNDMMPLFEAVFHVFDQYHIGEDLRHHLYYPLEKQLLDHTHSNCGELGILFLKHLASIIKL